MSTRVVFHKSVQSDMDGILGYYSAKATNAVADRFFRTFIDSVEKALREPKHFPPISLVLRRANIAGFPYHFLYREMKDGIRVLVLRHDRRHPSFGLKRA